MRQSAPEFWGTLQVALFHRKAQCQLSVLRFHPVNDAEVFDSYALADLQQSSFDVCDRVTATTNCRLLRCGSSRPGVCCTDVSEVTAFGCRLHELRTIRLRAMTPTYSAFPNQMCCLVCALE